VALFVPLILLYEWIVRSSETFRLNSIYFWDNVPFKYLELHFRTHCNRQTGLTQIFLVPHLWLSILFPLFQHDFITIQVSWEGSIPLDLCYSKEVLSSCVTIVPFSQKFRSRTKPRWIDDQHRITVHFKKTMKSSKNSYTFFY
jgi:hypothetical protein